VWDVVAGGRRGSALALVAMAIVAIVAAGAWAAAPAQPGFESRIASRYDTSDVGGVAPLQDTTPPSTTYVLTGNQGTAGWYISAVQVTLSATDDVGVSSTQYRLNDGAFQTYASPFSIDLEGTNRVDYFSIDTEGNVETPKSVLLPIDRTPPVIVDITPTSAPRSGLVTITWNATDAVSGVESYDLSIDFGPYVSLGKQESRVVPLSDGMHTIRIRSWDMAGLSSESEVSVRVDAPDIETASPQSGLPFIIVFGGNVALVAAVLFLRRRRKR
jgi:hypothetical protein